MVKDYRAESYAKRKNNSTASVNSSGSTFDTGDGQRGYAGSGVTQIKEGSKEGSGTIIYSRGGSSGGTTQLSSGSVVTSETSSQVAISGGAGQNVRTVSEPVGERTITAAKLAGASPKSSDVVVEESKSNPFVKEGGASGLVAEKLEQGRREGRGFYEGFELVGAKSRRDTVLRVSERPEPKPQSIDSSNVTPASSKKSFGDRIVSGYKASPVFPIVTGVKYLFTGQTSGETTNLVFGIKTPFVYPVEQNYAANLFVVGGTIVAGTPQAIKAGNVRLSKSDSVMSTVSTAKKVVVASRGTVEGSVERSFMGITLKPKKFYGETNLMQTAVDTDKVGSVSKSPIYSTSGKMSANLVVGKQNVKASSVFKGGEVSGVGQKNVVSNVVIPGKKQSAASVNVESYVTIGDENGFVSGTVSGKASGVSVGRKFDVELGGKVVSARSKVIGGVRDVSTGLDVADFGGTLKKGQEFYVDVVEPVVSSAEANFYKVKSVSASGRSDVGRNFGKSIVNRLKEEREPLFVDLGDFDVSPGVVRSESLVQISTVKNNGVVGLGGVSSKSLIKTGVRAGVESEKIVVPGVSPGIVRSESLVQISTVKNDRDRINSTIGIGVPFISSVDIVVRSDSVLRQGNILRQEPVLRQGNILRQEPVLRQGNILRQEPVLRQGNILRQEQILRQTPLTSASTSIINSPVFFMSPPLTSIPTFEKQSNNVFGVSVKRFGTFRQVGSGLSREVASALGSARVRGSAAASFQVTKMGKPIEVSAPQGFYKKGATLIERPKFRINTPGELREITFEGIRSQRKRGVY